MYKCKKCHAFRRKKKELENENDTCKNCGGQIVWENPSLEEFKQLLFNQYNEQNDGIKPEIDEDYTYKLTEVEFKKIIGLIGSKQTLQDHLTNLLK